MKLISLYIENFGGLSRYALDLTENLTVIEEANGFGKTTLAEFIRAMFYGFPRKAKTLDKSRRQKYTPWNGGKCGGNLVFEVDGCRYRVERTFGATPKGDSFTLIDLTTGRKSNRYSEELGLELFRLDGDSFERSTYLPQLSDGNGLTTDSIRSKLSNLVEDTNDVGNYEKAVAALKAKRSAFVPYRGSGGSVMQATARASQLQEQLRQAESRKAELKEAEIASDELKDRQMQLEADRERIRRDIRRASEAAAAAAVRQHECRLFRQLEGERSICEAFREMYPTGIPEQEQIDEARHAAAQLEILENRTVTEPEDLEALAFLEENRGRFEERLPTEEELAACRSQCEAHSELRKQSVELAANLTQQQDIRVNPLPLILLLLLGAAGVGAGVVLLKQSVVWSYAALGIGVAALIGAVFAGLRLAAVRKKALHQQQEQQKIRSKMEILNARAEELTVRIETFLGSFGPVDGADFYSLLSELEHDAEDYIRAKNRVERWQKEKADHEAEVSRWNGVMAGFFENSGLSAQAGVRAQLLTLRDHRREWEEAARAVKELDRELKTFREKNSRILEEAVEEIPWSAEQLQQHEAELTVELNGVSNELLRCRQRQTQLQAQVQQIPELQDALRESQEKRVSDQKKSDLLDDTLALLEQAKENLSGAYLGPIRSSFSSYLERLWGDPEGQVLVTPDLEVQLERFGAAREMGYFSAGQTDTVMLCMRFALVDALFTGEKPFVILDDPFINLDDERTKQALNLLKTLARDRQIIYLTCNSSRVPQ